MKLYLAPEIIKHFPAYTMYTVVAKGIDNGDMPDELLALLDGAVQDVREQFADQSYLDHPRIASWRKAFRSFGTDPDAYPPSVQHLVEAAVNGEPIACSTPVVAILNYISLKYLVPCGADDLSQVEGDFGVRYASGNEIYVPINSSDIEQPDPGEIIYGDRRKVMARRWVWRQGEHTKVRDDTTAITVNVDILPPATTEEGQAAVEELMSLLSRFCGAEAVYNVLNAAHPEETVDGVEAVETENVYDVLEMRGYLRRTSDRDGVRTLLNQPTTIYQGFDPTGTSLHIGHLLSLMIFHYLQQAGHQMIFLMGGGTAQVGDPTGKTKSRQVLTTEVIEQNLEAIRRQVQAIGLVEFQANQPGVPKAEMVNNGDWLNMPLFEFMREVALHFSVNRMVKMDTFDRRLNDQSHLSLFEFLYPTLQGYDFYHLHKTRGCKLQLGGDDQWTNILSGMELISHQVGEQAYAMTVGLLLDSSGQKMGKTSAGEAVWLDAERTSPFDFYQYWRTRPDEELHRNFRLFTFLPLDEIDAIVAGDPRQAQQRLAFEITKVVHGEEAARTAEVDAAKIFGNASGLPEDLPTFGLSEAELIDLSLIDVVAMAEDVRSKGAARRLIQQGAVRINDAKETDINRALTVDDIDTVEGQRVVLVRYGKQKFLRLDIE